MRIKILVMKVYVFLLTILSAFVFCMPSLGQETSVPVDSVHFPDSKFWDYVRRYVDRNKDMVLDEDEIADITELDFEGFGFRSLKGIEYFASLQTLICSDNFLEKLDLSKNEKIFTVICEDNLLVELDVSGCVCLGNLLCDNNFLTILDVSKNLDLLTLYCGNNEIDSLDVSGLVALQKLNCEGNFLQTLDVSKNLKLKSLNCSRNQIENLLIAPGLESLSCFDNMLVSLDLSSAQDLESLECYGNLLTSLDFSHNRDLRFFDVEDFENTVVFRLDSVDDLRYDLSLELKDFDVARACNWRGGTVEGDILTATLPVITYDYVTNYKGKEEKFDTLSFTLVIMGKEEIPLISDYFPDENLRKILSEHSDIDGNGYLSWRERHRGCHKYLRQNRRFEVSEVDNLKGLEFFPTLKVLSYGGGLACLKVSNLDCLEELSCANNSLAHLDVSGLPSLRVLVCDYNQLANLDVSANEDLRILSCSHNSLVDVVTNNKYLYYFDCSYNKIREIDVSKNISLREFDCSDNKIEYLDVGDCADIEILDCENNHLCSLDLYGRSVSVRSSGNTYYIKPDSLGRFDLYYLPQGFDSRRARHWKGAVCNGDTLYIENPVVTYDYDIRAEYGGESDVMGVTLVCSGFDYCTIDSSLIPDSAFRQYVLAEVDLDRDKILSPLELGSQREINVYDRGIHSLKGIELFSNLKKLECGKNYLENLDLSALVHLEELACAGNACLKRINISSCKSLKYLDCSNSSLEDLDVRYNDSLRGLYCNNTCLMALDLSKNKQLENFEGSGCRSLLMPDSTYDFGEIERFDMFRVENWEGVEIEDNIIRVPDFSYFTQYRYKTYSPNGDVLPVELYFEIGDDLLIDEVHFPDSLFRMYVLAWIDADSDKYLSRKEAFLLSGRNVLDFDSLPVKSFQGVEYLSGLSELHCQGADLVSLNLSHNWRMESLFCSGNKIEDLYLPKTRYLKTIDCSYNQLESLFVEKCSSLKYLDCSHNKIRMLNPWKRMDENFSLEYLDCSHNRIDELGFQNPNLDFLDADSNCLTQLSLHVCPLGGYGKVPDTSTCVGNVYYVATDGGRFDLDNLPAAFDFDRASNWQGGFLEENILVFLDSVVTYDFDTHYEGESAFGLSKVTFTLVRNESLSVAGEPERISSKNFARVFVSDRTLHVENNTAVYTVYTAAGKQVYKGREAEIPLPVSGLYVVVLPEKTWKVLAL